MGSRPPPDGGSGNGKVRGFAQRARSFRGSTAHLPTATERRLLLPNHQAPRSGATGAEQAWGASWWRSVRPHRP